MSHIEWPISNFSGALGMPLIESLLWTPSCKIETNLHAWISSYLFIYRGVELWAKPRCYWEPLGEHIGNKGKKQKFCTPNLSKRKKWIVPECMLSLRIGCMKFYFQNCWSPFFAWINGRGRNLVTLVIRFGKFGQTYQFKNISQPGN